MENWYFAQRCVLECEHKSLRSDFFEWKFTIKLRERAGGRERGKNLGYEDIFYDLTDNSTRGGK